MSTPTLEKVQTKQAELAQMIAALVAAAPTTVHVPEATISLQPGDRYCGRLLDEFGNVEREVIRMSAKPPKHLNYEGAQAFAKEHGGRLPTLRELALMRTNKSSGEFEQCWHWSGEQSGAGNAFAQHFRSGTQTTVYKNHELAVVLVRS